jgi:predicted component of type VI protein secretion system
LISIVFSEGPMAGERLELDREMTVGRVDCDLTLNDRQVSRRHVTLRPVGDQLHVEDLGSSNGTFVNEHRLAEAMSAGDGDVIRAGTSEMIVQVAAPAVAEAPPTVASPAPVALAAGPTTGGVPGGVWIATSLVEIALILTALTLLVYYAVR